MSEIQEGNNDGWMSFVDTAVKIRKLQDPSTTNSSTSSRGQQIKKCEDDADADADADTTRKRSASELEDLDSDNDQVDGKRSKEEIRRARAERKRCREKERRSNVNKGYEELTELLLKIEGVKEPSAKVEAPANRVDLIARTVQVMEQLYEENQQLRTQKARSPNPEPVTTPVPCHEPGVSVEIQKTVIQKINLILLLLILCPSSPRYLYQ